MFPDLPIIKNDKKKTIESLKKGIIESVRISQKMPVDSIAKYALDAGFLQDVLKSFPDPRKRYEVPIEFLLLAQIIQRLNDEHSLVSAPYMLNSAELIAKLRYSAKVLEEGFNGKNKYPREAAFHGETLKHVLLSTKAEDIVDWFNGILNNIFKEQSVGRTHHYIIDGTKLHVPKHLFESFQGAGVLKNAENDSEYGYKVVWIQEIIDRKGVIRAMKFAPINEHDLTLGRELVKDFNFERDSVLIMDRGFLDSKWITSLKQDRGIDVCIPLKKSLEVSKYAVAEALAENKWAPHPTRHKQRIKELKEDDLDWKSFSVFKSGVLVNFTKRNGEEENIIFADTRKNKSAKAVLSTYDLRTEIEESHRQMKCFQGLEKLPSKKYTQVVFRVVMGTIAYNLFNLFLNSEECESLDDFTLKTYRQKRPEEKNPDIIVYTETTFAIMKTFDFMRLILSFKKEIQKKLIKIFDDLSTEIHSTAYG